MQIHNGTEPRPGDRLMTPAQVAEYFGVGAKAVTRWATEGKLPVARVTPGGHRRFWESDVKAIGEGGAR